jgi:hypothetical protein
MADLLDDIGAEGGLGGAADQAVEPVEPVEPRATAYPANARFNKQQAARILEAIATFGLAVTTTATGLNLVLKLYCRAIVVQDLRHDKLLLLAGALSIQV